MNPKETMFAAFKRQPTERIPVSLFSVGVWTIANSGNTFLGLGHDPARFAKVLIDTTRLLDCDVCWVGSGYNNVPVEALGGKLTYKDIGAPYPAEPLVNTLEDLGRLNPEDLDRHEIINTIREATRRTAEVVGDEYIVTTTSWGPFTLAGQFYGVEAMMRGTFKNKEMVRAMTEFTTDLILRFFEPLLADGTLEMISLSDPSASGDLISRKQFQEFALPYLKKVIDKVHSRGIYAFLHCCGDTSDRLDLLAETGADCVSVDHKVDLVRAKKELGSKVCFGGNIDPVVVFDQGTPTQLEELSRKCIEQASEGGGYVLMAGCDIPPTVPLENIQTFVRVAKSTKAS